jgi:nucleoside-diphosphate-sugar epimerase
VARALLVGCGCRGRGLGRRLIDQDWLVRGTTRSRERAAAIEEAGIEAAIADPDRPGSILDLVGDVSVVCWLLGSADGAEDTLDAIHGRRLESLLERLVDTPVRGFLYEGVGAVGPGRLATGEASVRAAAVRWRVPVEVLDHDPGDWRGWIAAADARVRRLVGR